MNRRTVRMGFVVVCAVLVGLGSVAESVAGPHDVRAGQTLVTYKKAGTPLKSEPKSLAAVAATIPYNARVAVQEVKQPWARVSVSVAGQGQVSGWLRTYDMVQPQDLNANPRPAVTPRGAGQNISRQDISSAGRQLDATTERGFRATRADLNRAYQLVDAMERETQTMDSSASIEFIVGGALGRARQDYVRPRLLPGDPPRRRVRRRATPQQAARGLGGLAGGLADRFLGGNTGRAVRQGAEIVGEGLGILQDYQKQLAKNYTPQQEYYLGRAVAAEAIAKFGVDPDQRRRRYVRHVGDAVVRLSTRLPPNFGGYHFEVLNCDEINGISGPGGFVLITRGAVDACRSEDELASVLCHELGHVQMKHGERVLRKGRNHQAMLQGLTRGVGAAARQLTNQEVDRRFVEYFGKVVGDVTRTSVENNYGRAAEFEADTVGTYLLYDVLYNHVALKDYLDMLARRPGRAYRQAATHAPPQTRSAAVNAAIARVTPFPGSARVKQVRADRLNQAVGRAAGPR